ncbi:MAG: hypothetical protein ACXWCT_12470, partial [Flavitalea sp.]
NYQTVDLRTSYQNIALPDGRHHLSFKSLQLQLFRQRIILDSFTVTAKATDSLKSNYKIFFKKLSLTGVDFNAMSIQNLIKADTVFSEDPSFHINLYRSDAVNQKTQIPDADKILRELTGNLNLAFIGVRNAGIHFDIYGETKRSFFNSNKDNFEIRGFRINPDSLHPVSIRRFDMTFKDYSYDNEDSSTIYSFGSLEFLNRRILLNNFSVISRSTQNKLRNEVAVKVPYFELADLDWYQLIFDQKIVAKAAILNNPVIDFSLKKTRGTGRKFNLFAGLQSLDSLVSLANVTVVNGDVNMQLGTGSSLKVQDIDFNIHSNKLLRSTNKEGLRRAVEQLSFSKGVLKFKDITAELHKARFTGDNLIYADKVAISGKGNKISALIGNVYIDNIQIDDYAEEIEVDRLSWKNASVQLKSIPIGVNDNTENTSRIHLKNVEGNNTQVNFSNGSILVSTYVRTLNAASILKERNDLIQVGGFNITGENLTVNTKAVKINAQSYDVAGTDASSITGLMVSQIKGRDSLKILSSKLNFSTNLNDLFASNLHFSNVDAKELIIEVKKWDTASVSTDTTSRQSSIRIDKLTASEPVIKISTFRNDSVSTIDIPWSEKSMANASDILLSEEGLHIGSLLVNTTSATLVKPTGEIRGVQKGRIEMDLSNIKYIKKDNKPKWSGTINHLFLENEKGLGSGIKGKLLFKKASLGNVSLSSDYIPDFDQLMKANVSAWLSIPEGQYADSLKTIKWYNANYTNSSRTLKLDSFVYHPTQPLDSVLAHAPYQLDYITVKTGAVSITDFDVAKFQTDSSIIVNAIRIDNPVLVVYRDKKPPISPHKKALPLPVTLIKNISLPVSIQSVRLENGTIVYSEKNATSRKQGNLLFTNVSGTVENIINNNFTTEDSLSLTLQGRLMDSAAITLHLSESYADSLASFVLNATIKSADLSILNPVLIPLSNVKITSGILDSVVIHAVGRQDFALGEMNMYYRDFRILFVKDGNPNKSTVLQHMWSFMVNTFVIKRKNRKRTGI